MKTNKELRQELEGLEKKLQEKIGTPEEQPVRKESEQEERERLEQMISGIKMDLDALEVDY